MGGIKALTKARPLQRPQNANLYYSKATTLVAPALKAAELIYKETNWFTQILLHSGTTTVFFKYCPVAFNHSAGRSFLIRTDSIVDHSISGVANYPSHSISIKSELESYWLEDTRHKWKGISEQLGELTRILKRI